MSSSSSDDDQSGSFSRVHHESMTMALVGSAAVVLAAIVLVYFCSVRKRSTSRPIASNLKANTCYSCFYHFHWKHNALMFVKLLAAACLVPCAIHLTMCSYPGGLDLVYCDWHFPGQNFSVAHSTPNPPTPAPVNASTPFLLTLMDHGMLLGGAFIALAVEMFFIVVLTTCSMRRNNPWEALPHTPDPTHGELRPTDALQHEWRILRNARHATTALFVWTMTIGLGARGAVGCVLFSYFQYRVPQFGVVGLNEMFVVCSCAALQFFIVVFWCAKRTWWEHAHQDEDYHAYICGACGGQGCRACYGRGLFVDIQGGHWAPPII